MAITGHSALRAIVLKNVPRLNKKKPLPNDQKSLRIQMSLKAQAAAHMKALATAGPGTAPVQQSGSLIAGANGGNLGQMGRGII